MKPLALVVSLAALLSTASCAIDHQHPWLPAAVEDAAAKKQPLVIELYATWCGPCLHFEEKILTQPRVKQALAGVRFIRYDIDTPVGRDAYQRCRATSVPTFVGIDAHGKILLFKEGSPDQADAFLAFLAEAQSVLRPAREGDSGYDLRPSL